MLIIFFYFFLSFQKNNLSLQPHFGEMGERFKPAVLKTVVPSGTGGSNPSLSANNIANQLFAINVHEKIT